MGLDMFLETRKFFWTDDYNTGKQNKQAETIKKMFPEMKGNKLNYVTFQIGDWRKANHIHKWFVDNVQEGKDDCREYHVTIEQLKELKRLCKKALTYKNKKTKKPLQKILPTEEGFFFGTTEYDEWYFKNCEKTINIIDKVLKLPEDWDYIYTSSW